MKNYIIIGASHGIGYSLSKQLVSQGHKVFGYARTLSSEPISGIEFQILDTTQDVLDTASLPDVIDGFVYCPGSIVLKPFHRLKFEQFQDDMNINFFGMLRNLQQVLPNLRKSSLSSVVLFSTVAAKLGMPFHTSIAASKAAIEGFAKSLAAEYAPQMRVNVIAPSVTDTPLAERLLSNEAKRKAIKDRHPLKQIGKAEDIVNLASFLLSDQSRWMTGQILGLDGGIGSLKV